MSGIIHDIENQADEMERKQKTQEAIEIIERFNAEGIGYGIDDNGDIYYRSIADYEKGEAIIREIKLRKNLRWVTG